MAVILHKTRHHNRILPEQLEGSSFPILLQAEVGIVTPYKAPYAPPQYKQTLGKMFGLIGGAALVPYFTMMSANPDPVIHNSMLGLGISGLLGGAFLLAQKPKPVEQLIFFDQGLLLIDEGHGSYGAYRAARCKLELIDMDGMAKENGVFLRLTEQGTQKRTYIGAFLEPSKLSMIKEMIEQEMEDRNPYAMAAQVRKDTPLQPRPRPPRPDMA